jgi:SAM-dependent methyltransferase
MNSTLPPENAPDSLSDLASYYTDKLTRFGETARGVDWNGEASQVLRFEQLHKLLMGSGPGSITDLGCGYGAFYEYLREQKAAVSYVGIDVSVEMAAAASARFSNHPEARFLVGTKPVELTDYCVASGIFNVRLDRPEADWRLHIEHTLELMNDASRLGFAFNCLTSYSDADRRRDYLFYADPCEFFDLCKRRYSRQVALLHDYGLYEFTILVRKEP